MKSPKTLAAVLLTALLLGACGGSDSDEEAVEPDTVETTVAGAGAEDEGAHGDGGHDDPAASDPVGPITVSSSAFTSGGKIPEKFTCEGNDVSPPLAWSGAPTGSAGFAIVVDDPDAPDGTFVHWAAWNIDPGVTSINEGERPAGVREAKNDGDGTGYVGMCPPDGETHKYRFTVYALNNAIDLANGAPNKDAIAAITAAAGTQGTLEATFGR